MSEDNRINEPLNLHPHQSGQRESQPLGAEERGTVAGTDSLAPWSGPQHYTVEWDSNFTEGCDASGV